MATTGRACKKRPQMHVGTQTRYLQDVLHCDVHLQVLLAVGLESVVGEPIVIWSCKQVADNMSEGNTQQESQPGHTLTEQTIRIGAKLKTQQPLMHQ